jgi:hypothetical protein
MKLTWNGDWFNNVGVCLNVEVSSGIWGMFVISFLFVYFVLCLNIKEQLK